MTDLKIFKNDQFGEIRTVEENGTVLFCGSDIAKALGYVSPANAITAHCKGVTVLMTPSAGGMQNTKFMNWNAVPGAHGRCKITVRSWKGKNGEDMQSNDIKKFYDPIAPETPASMSAPAGNVGAEPARPPFVPPANAAYPANNAPSGNGYAPGQQYAQPTQYQQPATGQQAPQNVPGQQPANQQPASGQTSGVFTPGKW